MKKPPPFLPFSLYSLSLAALLLLPHTGLGIEPIRVVGTNSRLAPSTRTVSGSATAFWQRSAHQLGGPVSELDIAFMNWTVGYSGEVLNPSSMTIEYAWLERASTGQVVPLNFSGSRQLVMPANTAQPYWMADAVESSVWTGGPLARDEVIWLHLKGSVPEDGQICMGSYTSYGESTFIIYDPANDPGNKDFSGPVPTVSGQNRRTNGLPVMIGGRYASQGYLSVIGLGDSILYGMGDKANPTPVLGGNGFFFRASVNSEGADTIAMLNLARSGETASTWVNSHEMRAAFLPFGNVVVEEYGTNDIGSNATGEADAIYPRLKAIWQIAREAGVEKIVRTRLMPRTQSTSKDWLSLEDQTPNNGWGDGEARDQLNAYLDTALSEGLIDVLIDTLTPLADSTDNHYWLTNGTVDYTTGDGTHPNATGHALATPVLRAALESLAATLTPASYSQWASDLDWGSADASPSADPNLDGITNLMAYALDLNPLASASYQERPSVDTHTDASNNRWLSLVFRENQSAPDLQYQVMSSTDLREGFWSIVSADGVSALVETIDADPDGDGSCALKQWRVKLLPGEQQRFVRLAVTQQ